MPRDNRYIVEVDGEEFVEDSLTAARIKFDAFKRRGIAVAIWHGDRYIKEFDPTPLDHVPTEEQPS